jgi:hypothetical protein
VPENTNVSMILVKYRYERIYDNNDDDDDDDDDKCRIIEILFKHAAQCIEKQ